MPNTPALIGKGASAIAGGRRAGDDDLAWAEDVLGAVGIVVRVAESQLDAVTALSGSGPAYVFLVAEALVDAAVSVGLPHDLSPTRLTTQLLVGSAALLAAARRPGRACGRWSRRRAGRRPPGLPALEERAVRAAFADAVRAATAPQHRARGVNYATVFRT